MVTRRCIPAVVAFSVSSLTCAWSSAICVSASRKLQVVPQFGHTVEVAVSVAVAICEVEILVNVDYRYAIPCVRGARKVADRTSPTETGLDRSFM